MDHEVPDDVSRVIPGTVVDDDDLDVPAFSKLEPMRALSLKAGRMME
jgi:hypothetical protein